MVTQSFIIYRHGARYPLKNPDHNVVWPSDKKFWKHTSGKLSPIGMIQLYNLGAFFRQRYQWINLTNLANA